MSIELEVLYICDMTPIVVGCYRPYIAPLERMRRGDASKLDTIKVIPKLRSYLLIGSKDGVEFINIT
jgi:hypothetical protein